MEPKQPRKRAAFIDWYRGLACVLMIHTHVLDSLLLQEKKHGGLYHLLMNQLGGMPSRLFLFLAGAALMLRFDGDRRRQVPEAKARRGAALRGLEVLGYALLFRLASFVLAGAQRESVADLFRVDILNCIGICLAISAYIASPRDLGERWPIRPLVVAVIVVVLTPLVERVDLRAALPLSAYLVGPRPPAFFPIFPWLGYVLCGCVGAALYLRSKEPGASLLNKAALLGILLVAVGQLTYRAPAHVTIYPAFLLTPWVPGVPPTTPTAFVYRMGLVLLLAWFSFVITERSPQIEPLLLLGRRSLLVYMVHVEMVYGHLADPLKGRLGFWGVELVTLLLTLLMIGIAWGRERVFNSAAFARRPN